jgi:hypothetical protein
MRARCALRRAAAPSVKKKAQRTKTVAFGASRYSRAPFLLVPLRDTAWWGHEEGGSAGPS